MLLKQIIWLINHKVEKAVILVNLLYLLFFLRDIHKENLSLKAADGEQSNFDGKLKNLDESQRTVEN